MNYTAQSLVEMHDLRNQLIDRVEVLSKVKALFLIPGIEMISLKQVSDFFEVDHETVATCYKRNRGEIDQDGTMLMTSRKIRESVQNELIVKKPNDYSLFVRIANGESVLIPPKTTYFSPRAVLRIGMLLRDSEVAKEVRTQLLNTFECATPEQRVEVLDQEGVMLVNIIRAAGSPEKMAVELGKYREFMNRHIYKLETKVEELTSANLTLEEELNLLYEGAAKWGNNEVARKLIGSTAAKRLKGHGVIWGELYSNLNHACGMNLRARHGGGSIISRVREDEWPKVMQQIALLARKAGVDIVRSIGELNAEIMNAAM